MNFKSLEKKIYLNKINNSTESFHNNNSHLIYFTYMTEKAQLETNGITPIDDQKHIYLINIDLQTNNSHMIKKDVDLYVFVNYYLDDELTINKTNGGIVIFDHISPKCLTFVPSYDFKQSPCYGFILYNETKTLILTVVTKNGKIGFPKGKKKSKEPPLYCAFRELKEETNIDPEDIYILPGCKSEINEKNNVPTNYYFAQLRPNIDKKLYCIDEEEDLELKWMSFEQLLELDNNVFYDRRKQLLY